jgi:hypothetical protein
MKTLKCLLTAAFACLLAGPAVLAADHLAIVGKDHKIGAIDPAGRVILPLEFKKVEIQGNEADAVILVEKKGKFGMYDRSGQVILAPELKEVTTFNEGFLGARDKKGWTFYDARGHRLPGTYEEVTYFSEGLAAVKVKGKWGYIDTTGRMVIPAQYKKANPFSEGLAAVQLKDAWSYLKKDGSAIAVGKAKKAGGFHGGTAVIDDSWLINTQGQRYAKLKKYAYVGDFDSNGLAQVGVRRSHRTFLDYISIGWGWDNWGIGFPGWGWGPVGVGWGWSDYHHHCHHHGWGGGITVVPGAIARPSSVYLGAINKKGQEIIPANYRGMSGFLDGRALIVDEEGRYGMIGTGGEVLIPATYDKLGFFQNGLAPFSYDEHWGYINEGNQIVIPNRFQSVTPFMEETAAVVEGGKAALIDKTGSYVMEPTEKYTEIGPLYSHRAAVKDKKSKKWGYLDSTGTLVIPAIYDEAGIFD